LPGKRSRETAYPASEAIAIAARAVATQVISVLRTYKVKSVYPVARFT